MAIPALYTNQSVSYGSLMSRISSSKLCTYLCISYTDPDVLQTCVSTVQSAIYSDGCVSPDIAPTMEVHEQLALVAQYRRLYCLSASKRNQDIPSISGLEIYPFLTNNY
jgi:hypothetical protein